MRFIPRVKEFQFANWRELLIRLRRKIVPDVTGLRVGRERAGGVGLQLAHRITLFVREKIVFQKENKNLRKKTLSFII